MNSVIIFHISRNSPNHRLDYFKFCPQNIDLKEFVTLFNVKSLIYHIEIRLDIHSSDWINSPILAAHELSEDITNYLLTKDAQIDVSRRDKSFPLQITAASGDFRLVELFLSTDSNNNPTNNDGILHFYIPLAEKTSSQQSRTNTKLKPKKLKHSKLLMSRSLGIKWSSNDELNDQYPIRFIGKNVIIPDLIN